MLWKDFLKGLTKAVWSTAYVNNLPDSAFLHILPGGKKDGEGKTTPRSLRMFPYKDANGKVDLPHLRNAIARIPQSNRIEASTKQRLQARARRLLSGAGKSSDILVFKDADGQWWYLGIYSNKYKDRDEEILSESAHKEYEKWLEDTGFRPVITAYHVPRMKAGFWSAVFGKYENNPQALQKIVDHVFKDYAFAKATRVFYMKGFTYVVAKFLPGKEDVAKRLSGLEDMGMSHGFIVKEISDSIIHSYRSFEMSVLKRRRAANLLTRAMTLIGGKSMAEKLSAEARQELVEVFGEETVAKIESGSEEKTLDQLLAFKDLFAAIEDEKAEQPAEDDKAKKPMMMDEEDMEDEDEDDEKSSEKSEAPTLEVVAAEAANTFKQVHDAITRLQSEVQTLNDTTKQQAEEITALKSQLEEKNKQLEEVKKSDDEKIAAHYFTPLNWQGGYSASRDSKNVVKESEKEELTENQPAGESVPDTDNPLALGFWNQLSTALNRG